MSELSADLREQIVGLLQEGHATRGEIAALLGVSPGTVSAVKAHLNRAATQAISTANHKKRFKKAVKTARWARIMVKWEITRTRKGRGWEILNFTGPAGRESRGVVDLMAIRKDHKTNPVERGDFFEIVLIQVKGGGAGWPTLKDIERLRLVQDRYHASSVVLGVWTSGAPDFYKLRPEPKGAGRRLQWEKAPGGAGEIFK